MHRRSFLRLAALGAAATFTAPAFAKAQVPGRRLRRIQRSKSFDLDEKTITELLAGLNSGKLSAVSLAKKYLARIEEVDRRGPSLRAVIELNPDALALAAALDRERKAHGSRGPLHGIPVLIKDNIATHDRMSTTAGSLALAGSIAPGRLRRRELRAAGAVILGKTNRRVGQLRGNRSPAAGCPRGRTLQSYALDRLRQLQFSSAAAVAANLCAVAVGTETDGSILSPAKCNDIVGFKPTVNARQPCGHHSISHSGTPPARWRTVADAAILLGAMTGEDARAATAASTGRRTATTRAFLILPACVGRASASCEERLADTRAWTR